jgi:hypothetical protein
MDQDGSAVAALVTPAPPGLAEDAAGSPAAERTALVVTRPLNRRRAPTVPTLCDLFGLSQAEAEAAVAPAGGAGADDVARRRNMSLVTVRSRIRAIFGKSETENLRDFERPMAGVTATVLERRGGCARLKARIHTAPRMPGELPRSAAKRPRSARRRHPHL